MKMLTLQKKTLGGNTSGGSFFYSEDGTRTPINAEDVPPLVLGKRRVGTGRPRKTNDR